MLYNINLKMVWKNELKLQGRPLNDILSLLRDDWPDLVFIDPGEFDNTNELNDLMIRDLIPKKKSDEVLNYFYEINFDFYLKVRDVYSGFYMLVTKLLYYSTRCGRLVISNAVLTVYQKRDCVCW